MTLDNHTPMIGEKVLLTLTFFYEDVEDYEMQEPQDAPSFEHFKIKTLEDIEYQESNGTWIAKITYELKAQKAGVFTLEPLQTHIETIEKKYQKLYNKNKYLHKSTLHTQSLSVTVNPLPQSLKITGDYTLKGSVDKEETNAGEAVQFTVAIEGEGNIENLDFIKLPLAHAMVYEVNSSQYEKTFHIVSDSNYSIPVIILKYYNQHSKEVELLSTQAYAITIHPEIKLKSTYNHSLLYILILGLLLLLVYVYTLFQNIFHLDEKAYYLKQLKHTKNRGELLKKVAPFMHQNRQLTRLVYLLEESGQENFKLIKKQIIENMK
jgi:hypothetical protein